MNKREIWVKNDGRDSRSDAVAAAHASSLLQCPTPRSFTVYAMIALSIWFYDKSELSQTQPAVIAILIPQIALDRRIVTLHCYGQLSLG
jgi:hypothetical protein